MSEVVFLELNNWFSGRDYPPDGKLNDWVEDGKFNDDGWCRENKLCVLAGMIDMSENWCISAPKDWVVKECPEILSGKDYTYIVYVYSEGKNEEREWKGNYSQFLRSRDEDGDVYGKFGWPFLDYSEENFGVRTYSEEEE